MGKGGGALYAPPSIVSLTRIVALSDTDDRAEKRSLENKKKNPPAWIHLTAGVPASYKGHWVSPSKPLPC